MSLVLYYSGAVVNNALQPDSNKSLGGYTSSSPIPNGTVGNLFNTLTPSTNTQCRLIVVKNISQVTISNINISIEDSAHIEYTLAATSPAIDTCGNKIFEQIQADEQIPYQAVLAPHPLGSPIVASIAAGDILGIWIRRAVKNTNDPVYKALINKALNSSEMVVLQTLIDNGLSNESSSLLLSW